MIVERTPISSAAPFDLNAVALHCRADGIGDILPELARQAHAAAAELERYAEIALLDQTIRLTLEHWPHRAWLPLPVAPLLDSLTVTVTAEGQPFEGYAVVTGQRPALRLTGSKPCGLIVIEYQAGFGDAAADIPSDLSLAIMDQCAATFDARGEGDGKTNRMSPHMARIAARYRRVAL